MNSINIIMKSSGILLRTLILVCMCSCRREPVKLSQEAVVQLQKGGTLIVCFPNYQNQKTKCAIQEEDGVYSVNIYSKGEDVFHWVMTPDGEVEIRPTGKEMNRVFEAMEKRWCNPEQVQDNTKKPE